MHPENASIALNIINKTYIFFLESLFSSRRLFMNKIIYEDLRFMNKIIKLGAVSKKKQKPKKRSDIWWKNVVRNGFSDDDMLENFRMTKQTFFYLVDKLRKDLQPSKLAFLPCLDVEKIVAIALFKLASCAEYRVVGIAFGVHKTTVKKCVYRFCRSVNKNLLHEEIKLPSSEEVPIISEKFKQLTKMEPIVGAIDGTHIPITPPLEGYRDYVNRKGWPSLILQVVVDSFMQFRDISINHPGSCHDATVFKDSTIYKNFTNVIPKYERISNDVPISPFIIGDPAYPLLPWLMKGFTGNKTEEEESFNAYLSSGRVLVEQAIGHLKSRWRILGKRIDLHYGFVPDLVSTCCILHNLVVRNKEIFRETWLQELEQFTSDNQYRQPNKLPSTSYSHSAVIIRKHLKTELEQNHPLKKSRF